MIITSDRALRKALRQLVAVNLILLAGVFIVTGLTSRPGLAQPANPEAKIDLVAAMEEFANWVSAGLQDWDDSRKREVLLTIPSIVNDMVQIAATKRALAESVQGIISGREVSRIDDVELNITRRRAHQLYELVNALNDAINIVNPAWSKMDITTLSAVHGHVLKGSFNDDFIRAIHIGRNKNVKSFRMLESEFVERQLMEANELDDLARQIEAISR